MFLMHLISFPCWRQWPSLQCEYHCCWYFAYARSFRIFYPQHIHILISYLFLIFSDFCVYCGHTSSFKMYSLLIFRRVLLKHKPVLCLHFLNRHSICNQPSAYLCQQTDRIWWYHHIRHPMLWLKYVHSSDLIHWPLEDAAETLN